jgi:hypothetical protein
MVMRSHPGLFRLSFLLPTGTTVVAGSHRPSPEGCLMHVEADRLIEIVGPSREAVFEHAARLLRVVCRGLSAVSIAAMLKTPARPVGHDSWTIIVGADVAFSPTALDPFFLKDSIPRPSPVLELLRGARRR